MTRTEADITAALASARSAYHTIVDTGNRHEVAAASAVIPVLQKELREALSHGAIPCPTCAVEPIGVLKTPGILDAAGNLKSGAVYEVGCATCVLRARGGAPSDAVARWNAGQYVMQVSVKQDGTSVLEPG